MLFSDGKRQSSVTSRENQLLTFTLRHTKSEETFNEPIQEWEMTSDMATRDYSGMFIFKLIPCVVDHVSVHSLHTKFLFSFSSDGTLWLHLCFYMTIFYVFLIFVKSFLI